MDSLVGTWQRVTKPAVESIVYLLLAVNAHLLVLVICFGRHIYSLIESYTPTSLQCIANDLTHACRAPLAQLAPKANVLVARRTISKKTNIRSDT